MTTTQKRDEKGRFATIKVAKKSFDIERIVSKKFLSGGHYEVVRGGQERPQDSDNVLAICRVYLPLNKDRMTVKKEIAFGKRCFVFDEPVGELWGNYDSKTDMRFSEKIFTSEKWNQAFDKAAKYAAKELKKLDDLIKRRKKALEDAEKID